MSQIQPRIDAPFDRLPESVTSDIFVLIWRGHNGLDETWRGIHLRRVPYILSAVSHRWRMITLSTSRIWVLIDLSLGTELLAAHLARSKTLPIGVELALGDEHSIDLRETLQILNETESWARTSHLNALLSLERIGVLVDALNSTTNANTTGIYQSITIKSSAKWRPDDMDIAPTELKLLIPQSQALRSIHLDYVGLSSISDLPLFRLPGLESLEMNDVENVLPDSLLLFLDSTPNLKELSLAFCRLQSMSGATAAPRPRHSITLAKLESLAICGTEGIAGLNLLFRTLNMPKLWFLVLFVCSNRGWTGLDWEAICRSGAFRCLGLRGLPSQALAGLLAHINAQDRLICLQINGNSFTTPDEFMGQLAHRLLDATYCPRLLNLLVLFPLNIEYMEALKELKRARPSLCIRVRSDASGCKDGDELLIADSEENHRENSSH
ncbi:hypothetical protein FRC12_015670 [Ceratobasidium sp. 428]|nr:hypothetical protein FRC12_015670 [Ceratobasidium sp. 428]